MDKNVIEQKRLQIKELQERSKALSQIIAKKELELAEVHINIRVLEKEIAWINAQNGNSDIIEIFDHTHFFEEGKHDLIQCTKNALLRSGYSYISELEGIKISTLMDLKSISTRKAAVIYVICQHYGIHITLDNQKSKKMDSLKELIKEFKETIIFD